MTVAGVGQLLTGNEADGTLNCNNDAVTRSGNRNKLVLTSNCTRVTIHGNKNVETVALVSQIVIPGDQNTVTWRKLLKGTEPLTRTVGTGHTILNK
ncbi:MAG: hypothetical protein JWQ08_2437 [Deinococcus sp.]|nr:hypothetical protein [Deinococcus sp.]